MRLRDISGGLSGYLKVSRVIQWALGSRSASGDLRGVPKGIRAILVESAGLSTCK